jgi:septal ring factor EnvC (AmiA/AmiB activator)
LPAKTEASKTAPASLLLNAGNIALNENFVKNKGSLPWPVDKGVVIMHYGRNQLPSGNSYIDVTSITLATDIGSNVKSVFDGVVSYIAFIEDMQVVIIQHGKYFTTYSNLSNVTVQRGQSIKTGQVIGKAAANLDGIGAIEFYLSDEKSNIDPERWLKR